jgi:putative membrane protein
MANERTLLAWVRIGLASAGFGFVVARFGLFLRATTGQVSTSPSMGRYAEVVGLGLVLLGPMLVVVGATRYFRTEREIEERVHTQRHGAIWLVIAANVVLGLALAVYLVLAGG